jgi:hypothetical protein
MDECNNQFALGAIEGIEATMHLVLTKFSKIVIHSRGSGDVEMTDVE